MMKYDDGFHWVGLNYNNGSDLQMCRPNSHPIFLMFTIFLTRVRYKTVLIFIIGTSDLV